MRGHRWTIQMSSCTRGGGGAQRGRRCRRTPEEDVERSMRNRVNARALCAIIARLIMAAVQSCTELQTLVLMKSCRIEIFLQYSNSLISVSGAIDCGGNLSYMHSASQSAFFGAQKKPAGSTNTNMIHKIKNLQF
jgi:hypothetical protein